MSEELTLPSGENISPLLRHMPCNDLKRVYDYGRQGKIEIDNLIAVAHLPDEGHVVTTVDGSVTIVQPGWLAMKLVPRKAE